jgi:GT2 family glycosyltransferase
MEFSFIILTWNSERYIDVCIDSIIAEMRPLKESFEVHIVDNGSVDSTPARIKKAVQSHPGKIHPIFLESNVGTTRSRNMALKNASGRYIVIMDSDVQLLEGVIVGLRNKLIENKDIGLIVPKLIYPDGRHQKSVDVFPTVMHKAKRFFWLRRMERNEKTVSANNRPIDVDYAISAFWIFPRAIMDRIGLLDEKIFYSPEDVDYCLRIWKAGFRIVIDPRHVVVHDAQEISRGLRIRKSTVLHALGLSYFFSKHRYWLKRPDRYAF